MKRPLSHRLFSALLSLLVLTSSVGLTVQQHTCRMSGKTQRAVVLTPRHACAPKDVAAEAGCKKQHLNKEQATVKKACCAFSAEHHKVDASSHFDFAKVKVPALIAVLPAAVWHPQPTVAVVAEPQLVLHGSDSSPPPRAGRELLAFVCTLVV